MNQITKKGEPVSFHQWKRMNAHKSVTYQDLTGDVKQELKQTLLDEQHWVCCYCGERILEENSHIEHLKPRSKYSQDQLDYYNMLASCNGKKQCGDKKNDWYDSHNTISPLSNNCEVRFLYSPDGQILPAADNDDAAVQTIENIGLNIKKLIALRSQSIEGALFVMNQELEGLDDQAYLDKLNELINVYSTTDHEDKLTPYNQAIICALKDEYHFAEQCFQKSVPIQ